MPKKEILIPYTKDGSIPWEHPWRDYHWEGDDYVLKPDSKYDWKPQAHFRARLQFHQIIPIRSGYTVRMKNADTGAVYPMKGEQFLELISDMVYGVLPVMVWEPYKVGSNYNIRRITSG
jgi:hypothetical protein